MILRNRKAQSSIEMMVIIGAIVIPTVAIVSFVFKGYFTDLGKDVLKYSIQCQVRYGVNNRTTGLSTGTLGTKESAALAIDPNDVNNRHPYTRISTGW